MKGKIDMKKMLFCMAFMPLFIACYNNEPQPQMNRINAHVPNNDALYDRLNELSETYAYNNPNPLFVLDTIDPNDPPISFYNKRKWMIAQQDMDGFAKGFETFGSIGGAIGAIASIWAPLGIIACGGIGTLAGGIPGGIAYAVVWSKNIAQQLRENPNSGTQIFWSDRYSLNIYEPIYDYSQSIRLFDDDIKYANIGYLHNYAITTINNTHSSLFDVSPTDIVNHVFENVFEASVGNEVAYQQLYDYSYAHIESDYENFNSSSTAMDYDECIGIYFDNLYRISETAWYSYTNDFMEIVDEELRYSDEDRLMLINGCLSTFYYSKCLWKLNAPNPYSGKYILFNTQNGTWQYVETNDVWQLYNTILASGDSLVLFVPYISNGELTSLFLYDIFFSQNDIDGSQYLNQIDNILNLTIPSTLNLSIGSIETAIQEGTYSFQRIEDGFVVDIIN